MVEPEAALGLFGKGHFPDCGLRGFSQTALTRRPTKSRMPLRLDLSVTGWFAPVAIDKSSLHEAEQARRHVLSRTEWRAWKRGSYLRGGVPVLGKNPVDDEVFPATAIKVNYSHAGPVSKAGRRWPDRESTPALRGRIAAHRAPRQSARLVDEKKLPKKR